MKIKLIVLLVLVYSILGFSAEKKNVKPPRTDLIGTVAKPTTYKDRLRRNKLIGTIVKNSLEVYHYTKKQLDDSISRKAFELFIKKIDYGKQFLLKSEVDSLSVYRDKLDDQMISGDLKLVTATMNILENRFKWVEEVRKEFFSKKFDFKKKEKLELDPDKRKFLKDKKVLKDYWRKVFKHSIMIRYLSMIDEQNEEGKDKDKNKKKKKVVKKKLTKQEIKVKAKDAIEKKYKKFLARMMKEKYDDYLDRFYNAIANVYDPHTNYLPPKRKEDFDIDISGSLEGIGAVLQEDGQYIKVVQIVPGGAAWRQKELEVDDLILAVAQGDGEPVDLVDMRVDDAVRYIRGKKGTEVRLTVKKVSGVRKVIPIIRDVVEIGASFAKSSVIEHKKLKIKVGYIHVPKFYRDFSKDDERNCTDDVRSELKRLKSLKVQAMILDLRNNGGGALEDARQMAGLFIKEGPIVQVRNHEGNIEVLKDEDKVVEYAGPLIVLINRFSASASEIVAAALQDYKRAVIVGGENSHGKGTVQAILNLNQGAILSLLGPVMGALKVTIQKFYRVTGPSTQYKGVTPDIILPDPLGYAKDRERDLDYSLPWDKVDSLSFDPITANNFKIDLLKKRSKKRVKTDTRLQKVVNSIKYLVKRRDETNVSLNIDDVLKRDEDNKKKAESFKYDKPDEDIVVTKYKDYFKPSQKMNKKDKKMWEEDYKEREKEWAKNLQTDPMLEEAIYIMSDVLSISSGKKMAGIDK